MREEEAFVLREQYLPMMIVSVEIGIPLCALDGIRPSTWRWYYCMIGDGGYMGGIVKRCMFVSGWKDDRFLRPLPSTKDFRVSRVAKRKVPVSKSDMIGRREEKYSLLSSSLFD